jgi:hypothetical protein
MKTPQAVKPAAQVLYSPVLCRGVSSFRYSRAERVTTLKRASSRLAAA